jgi:hypothetical protein
LHGGKNGRKTGTKSNIVPKDADLNLKSLAETKPDRPKHKIPAKAVRGKNNSIRPHKKIL